MRVVRHLLILAIALGLPVSAQAQRGNNGMQAYLGDPNEYWTPPDFHGNAPYDGRFTFVRIRYRGYEHFTDEGPGWAHDYPTGETHLARMMRELTSMKPFIEQGKIMGGNVIGLDDPILFKYPVAYLSEPGGWHPTVQEVAAMRAYLMKGGFVIFDDFGGPRDWLNFNQVMQAVLPKGRLVEIPPTHPIFDSFFKVDLSKISRSYRGIPQFMGIFEDNDPRKRLMLIANYNADIGDFWQWSDRGFAPIPTTNEAYKLGVNYLVYALTH